MKHFFPNQNGYLQTNRSDRLGTIWASKNLDFQKKPGTLKLSDTLVYNVSSSEKGNLGLPVAFEFWWNRWWAICGTRLFRNDANNITTQFSEDTLISYKIPTASDTQFDITNPSGTTFRYTFDGTGTDPLITSTLIPVGSTVTITTSFNAGNRGTFTVTGSGTNYFEVTNASGVVEADKTIGSGRITVLGGSMGQDYSPILSDMKVFGSSLYVTSASQLRKIPQQDGSLPATVIDTLSSSVTPHRLCYFKKYDRLYYVSSGGSIKSINSSDTISSGDYELNPGSSVGEISSMVANSQYIWIGGFSDNTTISNSTSSLSGTISQWDGYSLQVTNEFKIDSAGVLAICIKDDVPYAIDTSGRVLQYTGYSFKEIARFPIGEMQLLNSTSIGENKFVHPNGFVGTKNNTLLILVNNENEDGSINENFPSGIWELDLSNNSLTHKYSSTLKSLTGDIVKDFGQNRVLSVGALKLNTLQSDELEGRSTLIVGFGYYSDALSEKYGIFIDSPKNPTTDLEGQKRGYFVTTWFESDEITSTFNRLWATFKKFLNATDKMIFKYRLADEEPIEATITWTSTTTFTTTTDISDYVGYEAEILQGTGSGACANILTVTGSGTYTATIDTAITGVTGSAKSRFQKWIQLGDITGGQINSYGELPIIQTDTKIQIKGILEWTGDNEFHKMVVVDTDNIKINP